MTATVSELPMTGLVMVYGTLKHGYGNHILLETTNPWANRIRKAPARFVGTCTTVEKFPMVTKDMPFPYLFDEPGVGHNIRGEVYEVANPEMMKNLDRLEGVPHHYQRKLVQVLVDGRTPMEVFVYFANRKFSMADLDQCSSIWEGKRR